MELTGYYRIDISGNLADEGCLSIPYQSEITNTIIEEINGTNACQLPSYECSAEIHQEF